MSNLTSCRTINNGDRSEWSPIWCVIRLPGGGGVLPYMGYIGMCGPKGYGSSAVLVINRVSILADFGHKQGMLFVL